MGRLRGLAMHLTRSGRGAFESVDPFGATIDKASQAAIAGGFVKDASGGGSTAPTRLEMDVAQELASHSRRLGPLVKRRTYDFEDVPGRLTLGWAQLPGGKGAAGTGFSLGVFADRDHFSQIAVADGKGRVFVGTRIGMDVQGMEPRFMLTKEPGDGRVGGGVVGRDDSGRMVWLASWRRERAHGGYTLEQMRYPLSRDMREGLEYRDAVAIAFFAAYTL